MKTLQHRMACGVAAGWLWAATASLCAAQAPPPPLTQEAYVWQRAWPSPLREAVRAHHAAFDRLVLLSAEITWRGERPSVAVSAMDYRLLRETGAAVGLALRVAAPPGNVSTNSRAFGFVAGAFDAMLRTAQQQGLTPRELQLDFDCPAGGLAGYREWLLALRTRIAPLPLTFTALPAWLDDEAFTNLAAAADGYVLQVRSLEKPTAPNTPLTVCDEASARAAVRKAEAAGMPFRVALPTCGYAVTFDELGAVQHVAEQPLRARRKDWLALEAHAEPETMGRLLQTWRTDRPAHLTGILWYRLSHEDDPLNWSWVTLQSVMEGRVPAAAFAARATMTSRGLWVIDVANRGDGDGRMTNCVQAAWSNAAVVASDAFSGFTGSFATNTLFVLRPVAGGIALRPGESRKIAWLRLDGDTQLTVEPATAATPAH